MTKTPTLNEDIYEALMNLAVTFRRHDIEPPHTLEVSSETMMAIKNDARQEAIYMDDNHEFQTFAGFRLREAKNPNK